MLHFTRYTFLNYFSQCENVPMANSPNDVGVLCGQESKWWLVPLNEPDSVSSTMPGVQKHSQIQTTGPMGGT